MWTAKPRATYAFGALSSSKPLGQAFDWENLRKHQEEFLGLVRKEVEQMDPREGAAILREVQDALKEDAQLLHRSHALLRSSHALCLAACCRIGCGVAGIRVRGCGCRRRQHQRQRGGTGGDAIVGAHH